MEKKFRYVGPRVLGTGTILSDLICASVFLNVQVDPLKHVNTEDGVDEPLYFEF